MAGMHSGHKAASGRSRNRTPRIKIGKPNSLLCKTIEIGGLNSFLTVTSQIPISKVISKDKNDVRFFALRGRDFLRKGLDYLPSSTGIQPQNNSQETKRKYSGKPL